MIRTRVAKILSPTSVILAAGMEQGVRAGMEFIIYELGEPVSDPETGESLGRPELHKARVTASQVQDRLTVATTRAHQVQRSYSVSGTWTETVYERLPLDQSTATAVAEPQLTVKVGDLVRSVS